MRSTIVSLVIVCCFAYLARSQMSCASPAPAGAASCTGLSALPNQVTSCSSGYLLSGTISSCGTACGTGCMTCTNTTVCLVCYSSYTLYATTGVCVALPTGCTAGNATNATAVTCTAVWANYTMSAGVPIPCGGTGTTSANGTTWSSVSNCGACTATATTIKLLSGSITGTWVTCTACVSGYFIIPVLQQYTGTSNTTTGVGISTPECIPNTAATTASVLGTTAGNSYGGWAGSTTNAFGGNVGCAMGTAVVSSFSTGASSSTIAGFQCTMAANTYWCPSGTTLVNTGAQCNGTASTVNNIPATIPANCTGGLSNSTTAASAICQWCTNSSFYLTGTAAGNSCVANNASCITQVSASNCTVAAAGYTLVNGIVTLCSNTTTSCTGGVLSTQILLATGATITGTAVTGCQYHNASGVCVQCSGYVTSVQNCTACPSNCVNCTMSSGSTSCSTCNSGYSILSNGSCAAACANGTNRSSNGSCVYGKNMIASAVAFASLVFYYIF